MQAVTSALAKVEQLKSGVPANHPFQKAANTWTMWAITNCRGKRLRLALAISSALVAYADYDGDVDYDLM